MLGKKLILEKALLSQYFIGRFYDANRNLKRLTVGLSLLYRNALLKASLPVNRMGIYITMFFIAYSHLFLTVFLSLFVMGYR